MAFSLETKCSYVLLVLAFLCFSSAIGQQNYFKEKRGRNVIAPGAGSSFINGDYANPRYENFGQLGFKRFLNAHVNLNLNYRKFNLDSNNLFNTGFMALDVNVEYYVFPKSSFSPYVFIGGGLILTNDFRKPNNKFQAGFGLEYLFTRQIGLTLMTNGNYHFITDIDQTVYPDVDEFYLSAGIGLNFYFDSMFKRKQPKKLAAKVKESTNGTVITTNPILKKDQE